MLFTSTQRSFTAQHRVLHGRMGLPRVSDLDNRITVTWNLPHDKQPAETSLI